MKNKRSNCNYIEIDSLLVECSTKKGDYDSDNKITFQFIEILFLHSIRQSEKSHFKWKYFIFGWSYCLQMNLALCVILFISKCTWRWKKKSETWVKMIQTSYINSISMKHYHKQALYCSQNRQAKEIQQQRFWWWQRHGKMERMDANKIKAHSNKSTISW